MKLKYVIGAALLILAVALFGCGEVVPTEGTTEPTMTEATEPPTTEATEALTTEEVTTEGPTTPTEPITRENIVTDAHRDVYTFADGTGVLHAFPQINLSGEYAEEINEKFRQIFDGRLNADGVMTWYGEYSYEYYIYEDILTLVFRDSSGEAVGGREGFDIADEYLIYRLHISDGSPVTAEEVLESAGVTEEDFYKRVAVGTGNACCAYLPVEMIEISLSSDAPMNSGALWSFSQTTSEEYVHRAIPYLNDDGELWFAGYVRQVAGADYYTVLLPYEQTEEFSPYYEQILTLALEREG